jgi:hypothetical protein
MTRAPVGCHLDWTELMEPANLPHLREDKFMEISGFHTTWQWQKNFFLLLPLLWVNTRMQGGLKL